MVSYMLKGNLQFSGEFMFSRRGGACPSRHIKIFCYLIFLQISGGASPSPTTWANPPTNPNLKVG